jgi:hypothetical protein
MGDRGARSGLTTAKGGHPSGCPYSMVNIRGVLSERGLTYMVYIRRGGFPWKKLKGVENLAGEIRAPARNQQPRASFRAKRRLRWARNQLAYAIIASNFEVELVVRQGLFVPEVRGRAEQSVSPVGMSDRLGRPGEWSLPANSGANVRVARYSLGTCSCPRVGRWSPDEEKRPISKLVPVSHKFRLIRDSCEPV